MARCAHPINMSIDPAKQPPKRVLHFVTGGFSGATAVAIDLVRQAGVHSELQEAILVLRRKPSMPWEKIRSLGGSGVRVMTVARAPHFLTIWQLRQICRDFKPDVLVAHGFPEHLIGRWAGLWARVPKLIHVEHNSRERYSWFKRWQAKKLAPYTSHFVGVSEGVKSSLIALGLPAQKIVAIPNGIDLTRFETLGERSWDLRRSDIVMCARFSSQKDHETAIRAMALLKARGCGSSLLLAGGGKARYETKARELVKTLGLCRQVKFLGHVRDIPGLLSENRLVLLSTHYEGMPLALLEGMAAGCALVASDVIGVRELIRHGIDGLVVPESDPPALAEALYALLKDDGARARVMAEVARSRAIGECGVGNTQTKYARLFGIGAGY
jgi:glycosyltransferase involved in cell wall biosynthesis